MWEEPRLESRKGCVLKKNDASHAGIREYGKSGIEVRPLVVPRQASCGGGEENAEGNSGPLQ